MIFPELTIGEPANLDEVLRVIAQSVREAFSAEVCLAVAINPINHWIIEHPAVTGDFSESEASGTHLHLDSIVHRAITQELVILDRSAESEKQELRQIGLPNVFSLTAICLRSRKSRKPFAVLFIGYHKPHTFDAAEQSNLKSFAEHAAQVLKNAWLLRRYHEVGRIGQELNLNLEEPLETLFENLHKQLADIVDTSYFMMLAIHQPRRPVATDHSAEVKFVDMYMWERGEVKVRRLPPEYPIFQSDSPKLIRHYDKEIGKTVTPLKQIEGTESVVPQSLIFVPLIFRGDSFGVLSVQHTNPDVYDEEDLQLLKLVGTQVAQALANQRMYRYFDDLDKTGQSLTQQLESENLFQEIVDRIHKASDADVVVLYPYDGKRPESDRFIMPPYVSGELFHPDNLKPYVNQDDLAWLALNNNEPVFRRTPAELYEALGGNPTKRTGNFEEREQIKSTAALALKISDEAVGVLFVNYRVRQRFDAPQKALILGLANYAAIAIRNSRLLNQHHLLERLRQIDRAISQSLDLKTVLYAILDEGRKVLPADEAAIMLYDPKNNMLQVEAARGSKSDDRLKRGIPFDKGKGITRWVYENQETVRVGNVCTDKRFKHIYNQFSADTISELDAPLFDGDQAIGVINYEANTENAYSQMHEDFITSLATQAVVAVKNAKLFQQRVQTDSELSVFGQIGHKIVGHLDLQELLDFILDNALKLTNSESGSVLLYDPRRESLVSKVDRGFDPEYADIALTEGRGVVWEAFKEGKVLNVDVNAPEWKEKFVEAIPNAKWELAIPIPDGDKFRGVINVERVEGERFTDNDERLISQLASLASIALHNAEQYEKATKLSNLLDALHNVDLKIIDQHGNVDEVVRQVLESAGTLTLAEFVGLHFFNEEGLPSRKYVRKGKNKEGDGVTWEAHLSKEPQKKTGRIGIITHVRQSGEPYFTQGNAQKDKYYRSSPDLLDTKSEAAVPLILEGSVIGVLNLESTKEFAFDEDHLYVLQLLADQAVVALRNARSFIAATEESKRFRLLSEVGRELASISDPDQKDRVFETVFSKITAHHEGQIIYRRYESERGVFVLEKFERLPDMPPNDLSQCDGINGQVARERRTILVRDVDDPEPGIVTPHTPPGVKSVIVAPVIFEDRHYGNLTLRHEQVNFYKESDRQLLDGFATQLAITLRRLEVVEAQKESEEQAKHLEIFHDLGQSTYELTHRLGNDLGLVVTYINEIRSFLSSRKISSAVVDAELDKILNDVDRVLNMSRGLKAKVAKSEATGASAEPASEVLIKAILEEAKWASPSVPSSIELSWQDIEEPVRIRVVTGQIIEILYTLVSNAIEAMPDGGKIIVRTYKLDKNVCVEISDSGPGISPANKKKIFNLFFSTKSSSGFGLWSARRYARANGGDLTMKSELGKGASFTLSLPIQGSEKVSSQ
ncbi:MAG: GAF domain-containing protein [Blastocatellia bacterium]